MNSSVNQDFLFFRLMEGPSRLELMLSVFDAEIRKIPTFKSNLFRPVQIAVDIYAVERTQDCEKFNLEGTFVGTKDADMCPTERLKGERVMISYNVETRNGWMYFPNSPHLPEEISQAISIRA